MYKYIFKQADICIILSNYWKNELIKFCPKIKEIRVLLNPVSIHNHTNTKQKKYILFAGTITKRKGYSDLIRSFAAIASNYPEWKLVFAGNGEIDNAKKLALQLNILDQVIMKGWVSGSEKENLFKEASVFCLPSYAEGIPMALLDAWSYKIPSIVTNVGGIPDITIDNINALVCEPGNIKQLTMKLNLLLSDENLRTKLSLASTKLCNDKLSTILINKELDELYNECLVSH